MKVKVTDECIACGKCVDICPEVFEMGDSFAEVKTGGIMPEYQTAVREAADECPVSAIIVEK